MQLVSVVVLVVLSLVSLAAAYNDDRDVLVKNALGEFTEDFARSENEVYKAIRTDFGLPLPGHATTPVTDAEYTHAITVVQSLGKVADQRAAVDSVRAVMARMTKTELLQFLAEFDTETATKFVGLGATFALNKTSVRMEASSDDAIQASDVGFEMSAIGAAIVVASVLVGVVLVVRMHRHEGDAAIIAHVLRAIQDKDKSRHQHDKTAKTIVVVV
ncbi:hypothetical protein SPRG_04639 [Saprolegnia parasitica CBS 223.65]|uniref:Uncharacterized protein n=1 Tax=Saprolegnia parasitica (strain CBS 223.65) TaxID=695850 RepID=A0A067CJS6_SAPPC|nr:hypothetical protein SPRG_04639 [Saprolegnia parasitica CBS 223.65]KDO30738.1 hypothetical protein SPRG_04639 [Saprolegnia parasitica CBS 223.65]|eukprot:XP_012198438.1 hypothetical protein SPRG_04639 [Saprolegnia parasitica CBS 223.65]